MKQTSVSTPNGAPTKKKVDLGAIAFAKVTKLEKRVKELEQYVIYPAFNVASLPST